MREPLTAEKIQDSLKDLRGWTYEDDALKKTYMFKHFKEAMSFIVRVGFEAEALDHHPDLRNVYNRVEIALNTHDAGDKVTEMDLNLAQKIEEFAWR